MCLPEIPETSRLTDRTLNPLLCRERQEDCTHGLCDPLAEDGQQEEGSDGWSQVAGDSLDVVKELPTVGALDDGDPEDADDNQERHKQPAGESTGCHEAHSGGHDLQQVKVMHRHQDGRREGNT